MESDTLSTIWFLGSLSIPILFGSLFVYAQYEKRLTSGHPSYHTALMVSGGGVALAGIFYAISAIVMTFGASNSMLFFKIGTGIALLSGILFFSTESVSRLTSYFD